MKRRLQNRISESSATLPVACVIATLLWWLPLGFFSWDFMLGWIACALTAIVLGELMVANALLRVRSFMTVVVYVLTIGVCSFLHVISVGLVLSLLMAIAFLTLFRSYEKREAVADSFHTALCFSVGSLAWPPYIWLALVLLWGQGAFLRSLSWRVLGAWLVGLLMPYWFWVAGAFFLGDISLPVMHLISILSPWQEAFYWQPSVVENVRDLAEAHRAEAAASAFVLLTGLTGFIHYLRNNYDDKIGVRMRYYCLMLTQVALSLWLLLQPTVFDKLFPMLVLVTAPTISHFFALTHSWFSNAWFILCCLALVWVAACCLTPTLWFPSF